MILVTAMQQIPVKEDSIARLHLGVNQFVTLQDCVDSVLVRTDLVVDFDVVDSPQTM